MTAPRTPPATGHVAVVTGGTSGIGRQIALDLATQGYRVALVGRGADRAGTAAAEISAASGNPQVDPIPVTDLARPAEVRRLAAVLLSRYPSISILVNNAGGFFRRREVTPDGLERTFALNVLAPFLLTNLLADRLRASAPARVVNIDSSAHYRQHVDFSDLQGEHHYRGYRAYGTSKLELLLLTREFARRFEGSGVTVNAAHPGFVASGFGQNNGGGTAAVMRVIQRLFARSVRRGAETPDFVATDPSLASVSGQYFADLRVHAGDPASRDPQAAARMFSVCEEIAARPTAAP